MSDGFDLTGPLPRGTTLLEASAGTGKTHTIAALVARWVAEEGVPLERLLVVTFGRAATRELRERVRERLVRLHVELADPAAARSGGDEVVRHLAEAPDDEVTRRRRRVGRAVDGFGEATIATVHELCSQVLLSLGTAGDLDPGVTLVEDVDDLVTEVVDDLYLRKWGLAGSAPPMLSRADALALCQLVVRDGQAVLEPAGAAPDTVAGVRVRLAGAVRAEVARRMTLRGLLSYDDLLTRLRDALTDPRTGPVARQRLRERYSVVLVDEFQDTDPVQWQVLEEAFAGHATLVLIADPKQAVYAFRGADVPAYLAAAASAATRASLSTSRRSDPGLLRALDAVFREASLGEGIVVRPLDAARSTAELVAEPRPAPLRLRVLPRDPLAPEPGPMGVETARPAVVADVTREVVALLGRGAQRDGDPLVPGDIGVLVRTNKQAEQVLAALRGAAVPAVVAGSASVFATEAAQDWVVLLQAVEQPHRAGRVRRLALTSFIGWSAAELDARPADADRLALQVRAWGRVLADRGVAALLETVAAAHDLAAQVLGREGGERLLTDLRHIGQVLHTASVHGSLDGIGLLGWLRARVRGAGRDADDERSRRLESDAAAVQVLTLHRSKGLEFPVVLLPFAWDRWTPDERHPPAGALLHRDGRRVLDVGGRGSAGWSASLATAAAEDGAEDLRLAYVGLTRARSWVVAWWVPATTTEGSALHRLLFAPDPQHEVPLSVPVPPDDAALRMLRERGGEAFAVEVIAPGEPVSWVVPPQTPQQLTAARFDRPIDERWRRTSYSALTAAAHELGPQVGSEPDETSTDDEPDPADRGSPTAHADDNGLRAVVSPMADLAGGTAFGTLVHGVLEHLDPSHPELLAALTERVRVEQSRLGGSTAPAEELAAALLPSLVTPLGWLTAGRALRDIAAVDRLTEVDFELPLAGGDTPHADVGLHDLVPLLRRHVAADDPLGDYAGRLAQLPEAPLRGYLTGSLDAVLRVQVDGDQRFVVADYKTNRLAGPGEELTAWHYRASALAQAMMTSHYPLQALLYSAALHRWLRGRLGAYDPGRHLGGVLYLFLRGMCGPDVLDETGSAPGVFGWRPPTGLVLELSALLDGRPVGRAW